MLTRCLALASFMVFRFPHLLLKTAPLWILGFQPIASAQSSPPSGTSVSAPTTNIQPATSDTSVVQESNQLKILGGQSSGGSDPNLIHQFEHFDLGSDDTANFVVDPDVANVISLINGVQPSSIDGLLQLTSSNPDFASHANLFLVNPAGIVFGENVSLNLPANLTATTGSGLLFQDQYLLSIDGSVSEVALSTSEATVTPLAAAPTIEHLIGDPTGYLFLPEPASSVVSDPFAITLPPGSIENRGNLQVVPQASITLLGQYVQNDGQLVAPGGIVNMVAIAGENLLRITQSDGLLNFDVVPADTISVLSPMAEQSSVAALSTTDLALLLTGGEQESANQIVTNSDGTQFLSSTPPSLTPSPGTVLVRGTVDVSDFASPEQATLSPGQVNILGHQINLVASTINADRLGQAGTISIGGMPMVDSYSPMYVVVDRDSVLSATSVESNGGIINVSADGGVWFYGEATVTGAASDLDGSISIESDNVVDIR